MDFVKCFGCHSGAILVSTTCDMYVLSKLVFSSVNSQVLIPFWIGKVEGSLKSRVHLVTIVDLVALHLNQFNLKSVTHF